MYLVSIDEKVLPLPMGININKFSNYFSDGILFIDYLDDEEDLYEKDTKMYHKAFRFKLENIKEVE